MNSFEMWIFVTLSIVNILFGIHAQDTESQISNDSVLWESYASVESFSERFAGHSVDLVFVLDRSASIPKAGWQSIMSFVYSVLEHFTIDADNTRVAVITYSTQVSVDINDLFNDRENKCSLMQRLRQRVELKVPAGYTSTHAALRKAFTLLVNSRSDAKKAVIVLTDGRSNVGSPPARASVDIRAMRWSPFWDFSKNGPQVEIFAFGVHDAQLTELKSIASPLANHTYFLTEFTEYRDLAQLLHKGRQKETWEITGRSGSCSRNCSPHALCVCSTGTGQYTCLCKPGYQGNGFICSECPIGQYKDSLRPGSCVTCPGNTTTLIPGAVSLSQCRCKPPYVNANDGDNVCQIQLCPELLPIVNGHSFHVWGSSQSEIPDTGEVCRNTAGDACHFVCQNGYRLHGLPALVCGLNGSWVGELPQCKIIDCHQLQDHGEVEPRATVEYVNHTTTFGSVVRVTCQRGWRLFGSKVRICNNAGVWTGVPMKCLEAECPLLPFIRGGELIPASCSHGRQPPGTVCTYHCHDGYQLIGQGNKSCDFHGRWDNDTVTFCKDVEPPSITCPADIRLPATSGNSAIVYWDHEQPHASDNSGQVSVTRVVPFNANPANVLIGYHQLKYTATDATGNTAFCVRSVQILERSVRIARCPENVTKTDVQGLGEYVTWSEPQFYDYDDSRMDYECTKANGSFFSLGKHNIMCYPLNRYDHACRFSVELKRKECDRPDPPRNGAYTCSSTMTFLWVCSVHCQEDFSFYRPPRTFYRCDLNGNWDQPQLWPHCSRRRFASRALVKGQAEFWYFGGRCEEERDQITEIFRNKVDRHALEYCLQSKCEVAQVHIQCGDRGRRRRRRSAQDEQGALEEGTSISPQPTSQTHSNPIYAIHLNSSDNSSLLSLGTDNENSSAPNQTLTIEFSIRGSLPDDINATEVTQLDLLYNLHDVAYALTSSLNFTGENVSLTAPENTSLSSPEFLITCQPGQIKQINDFSAECVNCPLGTHKVLNETGECMPCTYGFYQDDEGGIECKPCPVGTTTEITGAVDSHDCKKPCATGSNSPSGLEPCDPCEIGFYQPVEGQSSCIPCPAGQSTSSPGSTFQTDCKEICPPGRFNETDGLEPCELCPMNTYQPVDGSLGCLPCPRNTGTALQGADNITQCSPIDYCSNVVIEPCMNGGHCISDEEGFLCECEDGFTGSRCEVDVDECMSGPCLNNATCRQGLPNLFSCECLQGYIGEFCESEIDECANNPCANGGSCQDVIDGFRCYCQLGWTGRRCDIAIDACQSAPCFRGSCENQLDGFICHCEAGFVGSLCDTFWSVCDSEPCHNDGVCEDWGQNGYTCSCQKGFLGAHCEIDIDECHSEPCQNGGTCLDDVNSFLCQCPWGYIGKSCQTAISPDFDLVFGGNTEPGWIHLQRELSVPDLSQFTVTFWMRSSDASNFGTILAYSADYDPNSTGSSDGFSLLDYGRLKILVNGEMVDTGIRLTTGMWTHVLVSWSSIGSWSVYINGTLTSEGQGLSQGQIISGKGHLVIGQSVDVIYGFPNARETFIGELSQLNIYSNSNVGHISSKTNSCISDNHGDVLGWTQVLTGSKNYVTIRGSTACMDVNECLFPDVFPCEERRQCRDLIGGYSCESCIYGFVGPRCDQPVDECVSSPCLNDGSCIDGPDVLDFVCTCVNGFTGSICEHPADLCKNKLCVNNGTCQQNGSATWCECPSTDLGPACEDISGPCRNSPCLNGGLCTLSGSTKDGVHCECPLEFKGEHCGNRRSSCDGNPCNNGGTCHVPMDGSQPICLCRPSYTGDHCDVYLTVSCSQTPCQNNGTCISIPSQTGEFYCLCPDKGLFLWDEYCNILNPCDSDPCHNSGTCVHFENGTFLCACPDHTSGDYCEQTTGTSGIDKTSSSNTTTPRLKSCVEDRCLNGGTCFNIDSTIVCNCKENYKGKYCEEERTKDFRLYWVTVKILTNKPGILSDVNSGFQRQFEQEMIGEYQSTPYEGRLEIRIMKLRELDDGLEVTFELAYDWFTDTAVTSRVLTRGRIESVLQRIVNRGRLGPYQLSREVFHFEDKTQNGDSDNSMMIYLTVGVVIGGLLAFLLITWVSCKVWKDRRAMPRPSGLTSSETSSTLFSLDSSSAPYRRPSLLNNTHEMVILNPIGNPAYQTEAEGHNNTYSHTCAMEENPYSELTDLPIPYAISNKAELKEAFLLRRYSSKRSKESNIELAAALKANREKQKQEDKSGACADNDDYLKPISLPKNLYSKESNISVANEKNDGYLHAMSSEKSSSTLPPGVRLFGKGTGAITHTANSGENVLPPDYLEVCPPSPDETLPSRTVPRPLRPPRDGPGRAASARFMALPPIPPLPIDDEI